MFSPSSLVTSNAERRLENPPHGDSGVDLPEKYDYVTSFFGSATTSTGPSGQFFNRISVMIFLGSSSRFIVSAFSVTITLLILLQSF